MIIERYLHANCSESVVCILNFEKKQIYDTFLSHSDMEYDVAAERLQQFIKHIENGDYIDINSSGDKYTPALYEIANRIVKEKRFIKESVWEQLCEEIAYSTDVDKIDLDVFEDKLIKFAAGKYKKLKKGGIKNENRTIITP